MRASLRHAATRDTYLAALRAGHSLSRAAVAVGVDPQTATAYCRNHPAFGTACRAIVAAHDAPLPRPAVRWTKRRKQAFLEAFATSGNATEAAIACGTTLSSAFQLRRHDSAFAGDWALAKQEATQRLQDRLFEGAMNGFRRSETVGDAVRTVVWQAPAIMLKLAGELSSQGSRYKTIELTPTLLADAREKIERRIRVESTERAAEQGKVIEARVIS